eukprot:sb/3479223/
MATQYSPGTPSTPTSLQEDSLCGLSGNSQAVSSLKVNTCVREQSSSVITQVTHYLGHVTGYQPIRDQYFSNSVGSWLLVIYKAKSILSKSSGSAR